jgi:hypothetical protein
MLFNTSVLEDHDWREGSHLAFPASWGITGSDTRASIRFRYRFRNFRRAETEAREIQSPTRSFANANIASDAHSKAGLLGWLRKSESAERIVN